MKHLLWLKVTVFGVALVPLLYLLWLIGWGDLGTDPAKAVVLYLGNWSIRYLVIALAVTPTRVLTGLTVVMRFRRMLGLFALFYASLHVLAYLTFLLEWQGLLEDLMERPYISVGFGAYVILVALGATSTQGMMRRLRHRWKRLHQLVYLAAVMAVVHFIWLARSDLTEPLVYALIFTILLGFRLVRSKYFRGIWSKSFLASKS